MSKRLAFVFLVFALALASAKSYSVTLFQPSMVGGTELQPGDYKVNVEDTKVTIQNGKQSAEATIKVEEVEAKYNATSVRYQNGDGKYKVQEIRLGGTRTKLVFNN